MAEKKRRLLPWVVMGVGTLAMVGLVLEFGAGLLLRAAQPEPEAPIKAHDLSSLDKTFELDPHTWWRLQANLNDYHVVGRCWGRDVDFMFSTDAAGIRLDAEAPAEPERKILALGDSVTFGLGVADSEAWPARLRARLSESDGENRYRVINMGTPGFSAFQGLRQLDKRGLAESPDLVIACFGQNDFDTWNTFTDLQRAVGDASKQETKESGHSDLFVLAKLALAGAREMLATPSDAPLQPRLTREEFRDTLEQMRLLCESRGIPLVLLRWPQEPQVLEKNPAPINYEDILFSFKDAPGVIFVDLYPAFIEKTEPLYADPVHGNAAGCDAAAEALIEVVLATLGPATP